MISSFNLDKLEDLLRDFHTLTRIRITVFDDKFRELTAYPKQPASFCQLIRTDDAAKEACSLCDKRACETASRRHAPYTYRCHAGLTERALPRSTSVIFLSDTCCSGIFFPIRIMKPDGSRSKNSATATKSIRKL